MPDAEGIAKALREPLLKVFPPALLGRLVTIPYYPLNDQIDRCDRAGCSSRRIEKRIRDNHQVPFSYDDERGQLIASRCTELEERRAHDRCNLDQPDCSRQSARTAEAA